MGDVDGDGRPDRVGATLDIGGVDPAANPDRQGKLVVHVALASGQVRSYAVRDDATYATAGWLGLSDAVGDGRPDIFVASEGGYPSSWMVSVLEYGTWPHAGEDHTPTYGGVTGLILRQQFMIGDTFEHKAGFTCTKSAGGAEVISWEADLQDMNGYSALESTQRLEGRNMLHQVGDLRTETLPAGATETEQRVGANCPGLARFPDSASMVSPSPSPSVPIGVGDGE